MNTYRPWSSFFLVGIILLVASGTPTAVSAAKPRQQALCADETDVFLGLATDEEAYSTVPGAKGDEDHGLEPQDWLLTVEPTIDPHSGETPKGPQHSYDGRFLQVLPDSGRSYPPRGGHLEHAAELDRGNSKSPYVSFRLRVAREGIHTAFLRWTGGDTVGGGDSLYVVLYKRIKKNKYTLVRGQETVKPAMVPIDAGMSTFAGCCYDMVRVLFCVCCLLLLLLFPAIQTQRPRSTCEPIQTAFEVFEH